MLDTRRIKENEMNRKDEQKFGLYVFWGAALGGLIGAGLGIVNGHVFNGVWIGVVAGVFLGWFIAAINLQK